MAESCDPNAARKPRKLWIESTPFTPEGYKDQTSAGVESSPPRVKLTHFTTKPVIDFGTVRIGRTVTRKLVVENPNLYDVDVRVEKFPWKKNFSVDKEAFSIDEENAHHLEIAWTPSQSGNYRELMMLKYDAGFRVHALIIGHVDSPKKTKSKIKTRRGQALNRGMKTSKAQKNFASSKTVGSFADNSNDTENTDPSGIQDSSAESNVTSFGQKSILSNVGTTFGSPLSKSPFLVKEKHEFSTLRNALLPLHVMNDNPRDSCGSITAPASPSGLEAPVIEGSHISPLVNDINGLSNAVDDTLRSSLKDYSCTQGHRQTFCVGKKSSQLCEQQPTMAEPEVTGRPTYVLPAVKTTTPFSPAPVCASAAIINPTGNDATPRNHRRSRTFTKKIFPDSSEIKKSADMINYALGVIGSDKTATPQAGGHSSPDDDSLDEESSKISDIPRPTVEVSNETANTIHTGANTTALPSDEVAERLSSTHALDRTANYAIGCLPVPDISAIAGISPLKAKKRKSAEFSPVRGHKPTASKKPALIREDAVKESPRRLKSTKGVYGTPKGRALQRRRVARGSASETLPIAKIAVGSSKKKASVRLSTTNRLKKPSVAESPVSKAAKRSKAVQERQNNLKRRKVKMPVTQLVLKSSRKPATKSPITVRMPYSARNMYYDERWRQKQEFAFTTWLNYILTPDEFKPSKEGKDSVNKGRKKTLNHSEIFPQKSEKCSVTLPALSKEKASLRAYRIRKRLNRLRRAAVHLFESEDVGVVIAKIEEAVESGHIQLRSDKQLWADIGNKAKVTDLLLSFESLWLRIGLEVTFGEELPLHDNTDTSSLSNFIARKILSSSEIEQKFAHPTVPHSFKPGYTDEISKHILKRFLILIYFLEQAKHDRLIDHDPCLFRKESEFKNCKDILISFSRDLLRGEGDVVKHLSFLGYKVKYNQTYIDEFEYGITNIAVDLRDGIRLVRVVELLFHRHDLTPKMRVPAGSLLQKKHNVNIALKALESHGVDLSDGNGKKIEPDHVVRGNCDMTLALLWNIASHFQVEKGIDQKTLMGEIEYLKRNLRLKHMLESTKNPHDLEDPLVVTKPKTSGASTLLLEWCQLVCAFRSIPVYNFGGAFSDGRVMACLISHYQSNLIHFSQICMKTTQSQKDPDPMQLDVSSCSDVSVTEQEIDHSQLLRNEKHNLKLVQTAAYEMGGIPNLLRIDDICNTIPDCKVVRLFVSFLCTRLLDISSEDRAARTIQVSWRAYKYKENILAEQQAAEEERRRREKASATIQAAYKAYKQRVYWKRLKAATLILQRAWRAKKSTLPQRKEFLKLRSAVVLAQLLFRAKIARKRVNFLRQKHTERNAAASKLQYFWRGRLLCKAHQRKRESAIKLQTLFRAWQACKIQRREYLAYKSAVIKVQKRWRETLEMRKQVAIFNTIKEATILIQTAFRSYCTRRLVAAAMVIQRKWRATMLMQKTLHEFQIKRSAIVTIQCVYRAYHARKMLLRLKIEWRAVITIQRKWRATIVMTSQKREYDKMKISAVTIQASYRSFLAQRTLEKLKKEANSACLIQRKWKSYLLMRRKQAEYSRMKDSCIMIQCAWRCFLARRELERMQKRKDSVLVLQSRWRASRLARKERKLFLKKKQATILIQSSIRSILARRKLENLKQRNNAAGVVQKYWRAEILMRNERRRFLCTKKAAVTLQSYVRSMIAQNELKNLRNSSNAAKVIQSRWRSYIIAKAARHAFLQQKEASVAIQSYFRVYAARKVLMRKKLELTSAINIQRKWRATLMMKSQRQEFTAKKNAAVVIQCSWKCYISRKALDFLRKRTDAAATIQQKWRATLRMRRERKEYLVMGNSVIVIQCALRCFLARRILDCKRKRWHAATVLQRRWIATSKMKFERKRFLLQKNAAIRVQSFTRGFLGRKLFHKMLSERNAAAIIQKYWRGYVDMKQDRWKFLEIQRSAVVFQTAFRCLLARRELLRLRLEYNAAATIQQFWRATQRMKSERNKFLMEKSATIAIQCAWRRFAAEKLLKNLKRENIAAVRIQRYWRGFMEMKIERSQFAKARNAAVKVQSVYRCYLAKKELNRMRKRRSAALSIQRQWRAIVIMRSTRANFVLMKKAILTIQCSFRSLVARKTLYYLRRRNSAALVIQKRWKAVLLMRRDMEEYQSLRVCVLIIQRAFRCYSSRKTLAMLKKRWEAARIIQAKWRATVLMKSKRDEFQMKKYTAIAIQSYYRRFCAQKVLLNLKMQKQATVTIQRRWRSTLLMRNEIANFQLKRHAALVIQCAYRCFSSKKALDALRKQHWAAKVIQVRWRARVAANLERTRYLEEKNAVVKIQSVFRCILARKTLVVMRKHQDAAISIQRWWRSYIQMKDEQESFLHLRRAIILIQSVFRCIAAKKALRTLRCESRAASLIQKHWKATLLMKQDQALFVEKKQAVIVLQTHVRRFLARRVLLRLKREDAAARALQTRWRAKIISRSERSQYICKRTSAITIQSVFRGHIARTATRILRKQHDAAVIIQQRWRAGMVMKKQRTKFLEVRESVVLLQCAFRCFLAKKLLIRMKQEQEAARLIQCFWRGFLTMKTERKQFLKIKRSVVTIQCAFRCHLAQKKLMMIRQLHDAVRKIQAFWRARLLMKTQRQEYLKTVNAVILIQNHFRGLIARRILEGLREEDAAAKVIQRRRRATMLMRTEREEFMRKRSCIITIQRFFKCLLAKGMLSKMKEKRDAAIVIQRKWKETLQARESRQRFLFIKKSVIVIQCVVRSFLATKKLRILKKENAAATTIQMHWRSWRVAQSQRQRFLKTAGAVRMIQRVFRGFMIRKVITDCQILRAKRKCNMANRHARQHPSRKICNRMNSALTMLLEAKAYDTVYSTLEDLYSLSLLLPYCCERISEAGGTEVLCELISSSNRSFHAAFVQKFSINILLNLIRNPSTRYDTGQILGANDPKSGSAAVEMLVNVLSRFRDKGGRDPSHVLVFCAACSLLIEFCRDEENVKILKSKKKSVEMIQYINRETTNRMKTKAHKTEEARRKRERESVGYLTISSSRADASTLSHSTLLDITTRETSFVRNMDAKRVSTPKTKQAKANAEKHDKANTENMDPSSTKKAHSRNASARKIVANLFGENPVPPKLKQSIIPQKASWNTNIPIHRSKKVTKPHSPKFQSGSKTKKMVAVGSAPLPLRAVQNHSDRDEEVPKLTDVMFDENDPLNSINALAGILS